MQNSEIKKKISGGVILAGEREHSPGVKLGDVMKVTELVYKLEGRGKREAINIAFLPMVVSEMELLLLEKRWPYGDDVKKTVSDLRVFAREIALKMMFDYEHDGGSGSK